MSELHIVAERLPSFGDFYGLYSVGDANHAWSKITDTPVIDAAKLAMKHGASSKDLLHIRFSNGGEFKATIGSVIFYGTSEEELE